MMDYLKELKVHPKDGRIFRSPFTLSVTVSELCLKKKVKQNERPDFL